MSEKSSNTIEPNEVDDNVESNAIPTFDGSAQDKASDFANYFCSYAQLYHQKQMLADHNRMAAYHAAIMGNSAVFKDKVVMDVGTGSGILAVWAAQAGAKRVYAVEYTDMAKHAQSVMEANGVADVVKVIQGAVEDLDLSAYEDDPDILSGTESSISDEGNEGKQQVVDIIISEWMGYFLLRESMLDSVIRARDTFLKRNTGLMFPSHATMYYAPIYDEKERQLCVQDYHNAMGDWSDFSDSTKSVYGVDMSVLEENYDREQKEYYMLSSKWAELEPQAVLATPVVVKELDMSTCTLVDSNGIFQGDEFSTFDFDIDTDSLTNDVSSSVSGFAGWFTTDFKSRTDAVGIEGGAPTLEKPAFLSTGPEAGYTHWGQQIFHTSNIPLLKGEITSIQGGIELTRTKENTRLYNCRIRYCNSRRSKTESKKSGNVLMKGSVVENVYQIP